MQYRTNLLLNLLAHLGWTLFSLLTMNIISSRASSISLHWSKEEYTLLWGMFRTSIEIVWFFARRNINNIPYKITQGDLDFLIVKPFNSKLLASLGKTRIEVLPAFIFSVYVSIKALTQIETTSFFGLRVLLFLILILFAALLLYSLYITFVTFSFWLLGAYNLNSLFTKTMEFGNYPISTFGKFFELFFTCIFPLAFISTFPAEAIIDNSLFKVLLVILVAVISYKVSNLLWNLGLKRYESASS